MSYATHLKGLGSGHEYPFDTPMNLDPIDGRPVCIEYDLERLRYDHPDLQWYRPERRDMWRFGALLPLDLGNPQERDTILSLGEGHTPLLPLSDHALARRANLQLWLKDEGFHHPGFGGNPTFSFKDRGMAVVASMARHFGLRHLAVPTQGNAGDSLCRYASAGDMALAVAMPTDTPLPILGSVAAAAVCNPDIHLELVEGTIREAGQLIKEKYLPRGYFNCATFQEPGWRIEGKKTLGLEIAEALHDYSGWRLPDAIVYPTGGGTGVLGMWKAFDELQALGLIGDKRPRIYCVQAAATAPLVDAFEAGQHDTTAVTAGTTLAVGLNVPGGVGHFEVLRILRASGGSALAVTEREIAHWVHAIWRERHWWICPEGAACLAALEKLLELNEIRRKETVVIVNTGSFEKYLPNIRHLL